MDFLPFPIAYLLAGAFVTLLCFVLLLNVFGLPANWIVLGLVALWKMVHPGAANLDVWFWVMMVGLALIGEALELGMQILKAKRYGSSSSGTFAGMVGAIAGAILLAPLFFGLGALIGALAGAWIGCFLMELVKGRPVKEALDAAFGAMMAVFWARSANAARAGPCWRSPPTGSGRNRSPRPCRRTAWTVRPNWC